MSRSITPDVVAAQLAAMGSTPGPYTIDRLAEALGVAASHGALRHAVADLAACNGCDDTGRKEGWVEAVDFMNELSCNELGEPAGYVHRSAG